MSRDFCSRLKLVHIISDSTYNHLCLSYTCVSPFDIFFSPRQGIIVFFL